MWWNAYIANNLRPTNIKSALEIILETAEIRSNLIERPLSFYRPKLSKALLNLMEQDKGITATRSNFRAFMRAVNLLGGGVIFESMNDLQCMECVDMCRKRAQLSLQE